MHLHELIVRSARAGAGRQDPSGAMPAGHNGPYGDPETPARNTGHWLITFATAHEWTGEASLLQAAHTACDYLLQPPRRPGGHTFHHRVGPGKNRCNGVIGQAWTIEALTFAADALQRTDALHAAREVFHLHPFDERRGMWDRIDVDGTNLLRDPTFNHQAWFAAAAAILGADDEEAKRQATVFLDHLHVHMGLHADGTIRHMVREGPWRPTHPRVYRNLMRRPPWTRRALRRKAVGYHGFNLYALGLLKDRLPKHPVWRSRAIGRAVHRAQSDRFRRALRRSPYAYPYNPPGFEVPFGLLRLASMGEKDIGSWVDEQLARTWDSRSGLMERGTQDPATGAARIYEAVRLPNVRVSVGDAE